MSEPRAHGPSSGIPRILTALLVVSGDGGRGRSRSKERAMADAAAPARAADPDPYANVDPWTDAISVKQKFPGLNGKPLQQKMRSLFVRAVGVKLPWCPGFRLPKRWPT